MSTAKKSPAAADPIRQMKYAVLPERLPRIPPENMSDEQRKVTAELTASRGSIRGPFSATMRCPELMDRLQKLGACIRFELGLDMRINRMASLMVARHWTNQYEWHAGIPFALKAGVKPHIIDAIGEGRRPSNMAADEAALYEFLTELFTHKSVCDITYEMAVTQFGEQGIVELLALVGYYAMNAMIMNVSRTPVRDGDPLPLAPMPGQLRPEL
jgi:4-carboxymuconolactone decarboxylase